MEQLILEIDSIISNCNNKINDKIIGVNYLERLKFLLIDTLKEKDFSSFNNISDETAKELNKIYGENNLVITIQQYRKSLTKIKNECVNDLLSVVLQGFTSLDIYQDKKENEFYSLNLFPKTGIVLSKNTLISEKIIKDSLILKIVNIGDTSNIDIEI
ncbi:hypothetical protein OAJ74_00410 [Alphaproteobacteria bacterium]|nr:hypothetical protein [Alphaproteobacteria bacterium]